MAFGQSSKTLASFVMVKTPFLVAETVKTPFLLVKTAKTQFVGGYHLLTLGVVSLGGFFTYMCPNIYPKETL